MAERVKHIMNTSTANDAVQWLFDLNAFLASCEQQDNPSLRGQPVIVVQSAVATAASYTAKDFGQKPAPSSAKHGAPEMMVWIPWSVVSVR